MSALQKYIDSHNAWQAIFDKAPIAYPSTTDECQSLFIRLAGDLSPENLCCDGELPRAQVAIKARHLNACWSELESIYGRKVDEGEVWNWSI